MIIEKQLSPTLVRHYSDRYKMIRQIETGVLYADAVDTIPCRYTYEETDEPIITVGLEENERRNNNEN